MTGKASKEMELARAAYQRSGGTLSVKQLAQRYKLAPSTIYRAKWWTGRKTKTKTDNK